MLALVSICKVFSSVFCNLCKINKKNKDSKKKKKKKKKKKISRVQVFNWIVGSGAVNLFYYMATIECML